ncbi:hypothetical protein DFH08DRAFT_1055195 [Mycena albidolilacea]|uniref:Rhodopsin domain-containing protein n=1 Tax=Mycena albidolilacea TaxID=1033008 RepID=A0AAD6Z3I4_9AGAR|nr:hypothetical protein DFH08DRAFT_1055195 [Mycena albidolilacea]
MPLQVVSQRTTTYGADLAVGAVRLRHRGGYASFVLGTILARYAVTRTFLLRVLDDGFCRSPTRLVEPERDKILVDLWHHSNCISLRNASCGGRNFLKHNIGSGQDLGLAPSQTLGKTLPKNCSAIVPDSNSQITNIQRRANPLVTSARRMWLRPIRDIPDPGDQNTGSQAGSIQIVVTSVACSSIAFGATIYRLYKRRGRFWADDVWALIASLALVLQNNTGRGTSRFTAFYLMATAFYIIIWASRLSILFSIIRIDPSAERRQRLLWISLGFAAAAIFLLSQVFWLCEGGDTSWKNFRTPHCEAPLQVAVCQIVTDVIADTILLSAPLPLFRNLMNKSLGHKLRLIFSTCVATTVVSVAHVTFIFQEDHANIGISRLVENCLSLFVANLPVIITTTIDIVGEQDRIQTRPTTQFTSIFWSAETQTTRDAIELHMIGEDGPVDGPLSCAKIPNDVPVDGTADVIILAHPASSSHV